MSHVVHIDGTQELPTIFGETDSTTGEWKIKTSITPSVGWGTNGYHILKDGNSLTDQSGQGNNWTAMVVHLQKQKIIQAMFLLHLIFKFPHIYMDLVIQMENLQ